MTTRNPATQEIRYLDELPRLQLLLRKLCLVGDQIIKLTEGHSFKHRFVFTEIEIVGLDSREDLPRHGLVTFTLSSYVIFFWHRVTWVV